MGIISNFPMAMKMDELDHYVVFTTNDYNALPYSQISDAIGTLNQYAFEWHSAASSSYYGGFQVSIKTAYFKNVVSLYGTFEALRSLETVLLPNCTSIGQGTFYQTYLKSIYAPKCTFIGSRAFYMCHLSEINFPYVTTIESYAFQYCTKLKSISLPLCTTLSIGVFGYCYSLNNVYLPECTGIPSSTFENCSNISILSLPKCSFISNSAFYSCTKLTALYLMSTSVVSLATSLAFTYVPILLSSYNNNVYGSVYVPASLVNAYKTANQWKYLSSRIVGV